MIDLQVVKIRTENSERKVHGIFFFVLSFQLLPIPHFHRVVC